MKTTHLLSQQNSCPLPVTNSVLRRGKPRRSALKLKWAGPASRRPTSEKWVLIPKKRGDQRTRGYGIASWHSTPLWPEASGSGGKMFQGGVYPLTDQQEGRGRPIMPPRRPSGWSGLTLWRNRPASTPELYQSDSWLGRAVDLRTMKWHLWRLSKLRGGLLHSTRWDFVRRLT